MYITRENDLYDYAISLVRMLAMVMIITCHFMQFYGMELAFWLNVGVQIFLCISGFLYGKKVINDDMAFIISNFKKILKDYYIYVFICIILYTLFVPELMPIRTVILLLLCRTTVDGLGHLWFINCILCCYFITPLIDKIERKISGDGTIKYILKIGCLLIGIEIIFYYYVQSVTGAWVNCYVIGFLLGKYVKSGKELKKINRMIFPLTVILNIGQIYLQYINKSVVSRENIFFVRYINYAHICLGITIFLVIYLFFQDKRCLLEPFKKILTLSDKYSYDIFLVHSLYIMGPFNLEKITVFPVFNIGIILVLITLSGILLYWLRNAIFDNSYRNKIVHRI